MATLVDSRGHNSQFALTRGYDAGAIGTDQPCGSVTDVSERAHHVHYRYPFSYANDERKPGVGGFHDGIRGKRRRDVNDARISACCGNGSGDGIEHRNAFVLCPALAWRNASHDARTILHHLPSVEGTLFSGNALNDNPCIFVYQDTQASLRKLNNSNIYHSPRKFGKGSV